MADDWFDDSAEGRSLLERILKEHPNSAYYPYAVALAPEALRRPATEADITRTSDAASRSKDSPAYPYLVATAGAYAEELAVAASAKRDVRAAAKYYAIAAKYAAAIAASTENPALLQDADLAKSRIEHDRTQLENAVSIPVQRPRR